MRVASPKEQERAGAANARPTEEFATAEQAHCDWAPAGYSVERSADDQALPGYSAARPADDWALADFSAGRSADDWAQLGSLLADCSAQAVRGERSGSLVARPEYWPVAELPHGCKVPLPVWPARLRGR
jgi:hypothetical protein